MYASPDRHVCLVRRRGLSKRPGFSPCLAVEKISSNGGVSVAAQPRKGYTRWWVGRCIVDFVGGAAAAAAAVAHPNNDEAGSVVCAAVCWCVGGGPSREEVDRRSLAGSVLGPTRPFDAPRASTRYSVLLLLYCCCVQVMTASCAGERRACKAGAREWRTATWPASTSTGRTRRRQRQPRPRKSLRSRCSMVM